MNNDIKAEIDKLHDAFCDEVDSLKAGFKLKLELIATAAYFRGREDGITSMEQRLNNREDAA